MQKNLENYKKKHEKVVKFTFEVISQMRDVNILLQDFSTQTEKVGFQMGRTFSDNELLQKFLSVRTSLSYKTGKLLAHIEIFEGENDKVIAFSKELQKIDANIFAKIPNSALRAWLIKQMDLPRPTISVVFRLALIFLIVNKLYNSIFNWLGWLIFLIVAFTIYIERLANCQAVLDETLKKA